MRPMTLRLLPALGLSTLLAALLGAPPSARAVEPVDVVATTAMIADVAQTVAGPCAHVLALMGPGIDPHLYKASAGDVALLFAADAILTTGLNLEGQMGDVLAKLAQTKTTRAVASLAVPEDQVLHTGHGTGVDPHVWMDAGLWSRTVPVIGEAIAGLRPDCAADITARGAAYQTELAALDRWIRDSIATIPVHARLLVTAHDAFTYYGRSYGLEVRGIQGVSTDSEAGIADIRAVVDTVVARKVPAIFVESTINPRTIEAVIAAAADQNHKVALGGALFSDAMGPPETAEGTYIGMLRQNTLTIVTALGGKPEPLPAALHAWAARWKIEAGQ